MTPPRLIINRYWFIGVITYSVLLLHVYLTHYENNTIYTHFICNFMSEVCENQMGSEMTPVGHLRVRNMLVG